MLGVDRVYSITVCRDCYHVMFIQFVRLVLNVLIYYSNQMYIFYNYRIINGDELALFGAFVITSLNKVSKFSTNFFGSSDNYKHTNTYIYIHTHMYMY